MNLDLLLVVGWPDTQMKAKLWRHLGLSFIKACSVNITCIANQYALPQDNVHFLYLLQF